METLVIVESKAKCDKIESILGPSYKCQACLGHIYELKEGLEAVRPNDGFEPDYRIIPSKRHLVADLKRAAKRAKRVIIASDPDREGEAIAQHLMEVLKVGHKATRASFNEITKKAVKEAVAQPRELDVPLCNAQKARRVLDRLFGYELSPVLWSHVAKKLSAGRCQSPALEIICQREREIERFASKSFYSIAGALWRQKKGGKSPVEIKVRHPENITDLDSCVQLLHGCIHACFLVSKIQKKERTSNPPPPFSTSTMQQEASSRLGMKPKTTMQVAQRLYERGHITYMRTDAHTLSDEAKKLLGDYVLQNYGKEYFCERQYSSKVKNTQEAHECIRPVKVINSPDKLSFESSGESRLYELIWKRSVASQMSQKKYVEQVATILAQKSGETILLLLNQAEQTIFEGWEKLYTRESGKLPKLKQGDHLMLNYLEGDEKDTKPKPRFTEASLVKELERSGIGRPSTFSNIIATLQDRNYVEVLGGKTQQVSKHHLRIDTDSEEVVQEVKKKRGPSEKDKLKATELGIRVSDFLRDNFPKFVTEELTSTLESDLDLVAGGNADWKTVVSGFYDNLKPQLSILRQTTSSGEKAKILGEYGKYTYKRLETRFGWALVKQKSDQPRSKPQYLSIAKNLYGDGSGLTLQQAICLYKFPRTIQLQEGRRVDLCYGKNGFYLKCGVSGKSTSIDGDFSLDNLPTSNLLAQSLDNLSTETETEGSSEQKSTIVKKLDKVTTIWQGPYGPFLSQGRKTASIPSNIELDSIDLVKAKEIMQENWKKKQAKWNQKAKGKGKYKKK